MTSMSGVTRTRRYALKWLAMRALVQRVSRAEVRVDGVARGRIGRGLLVMVAIGKADTPDDGRALAEKIVNLRVFENDAGRMDRTLLESSREILCVSEFTLYGDCRRGRRPSYTAAASPESARPLYEAFVDSLRALVAACGGKVETGKFQAMMEVEAVNDGPVTLLLDSEKA
jgi:D-aminoacyl-tRNA deacylase